jgi:prophage antirepressor-like protein
MQLSVIRNERFEEAQCDFFSEGDHEVWLTREQIGRALGYSNPGTAIKNIHARYEDRLNHFSTQLKLSQVEGGRTVEREAYVYSSMGVYEICRWSRQPKANQFMDWTWKIIEEYRKGRLVQAPHAPIVNEDLEVRKEQLRIDKANLLMQMVANFQGILSPPSIQLLANTAAETAIPTLSLPKPQIAKSYTATQIAESLGISKQKVGRLANLHGLKTPLNGIIILDQARYANKQVENFLYNENGKRAFEELLSQS